MAAANVHAAPWVYYEPGIRFAAGAKQPTPATAVSLRWKPGYTGPFLVVTLGDLTEARVDAIVSATGSYLNSGRGVGAAILIKGGPAIQTECQAWIDEHGFLPVGQAMATSAGTLPCSHVIHTVGPAANSDEPTTEQAQELRDAVRRALREADRLQLTSVAMPAISAGNNGYPTKLATKVIVKECATFAIENESKTTLKTIAFMETRTQTYRNFKKALLWTEEVFGLGMVEKVDGPIKDFHDESILTKENNLCLHSLPATPFEFLSPDHADYKRIIVELPREFARRVVSVRRVRAPARKLVYEEMKTTLKQGLFKEMETLYHGTPDRWRASAIALNGFDISIVTHGRSHGNGVYTTTDVCYALYYTKSSGSLLRLRGLVSDSTIINYDIHVFPNPAALRSVAIIDYGVEDEQDRKQI